MERLTLIAVAFFTTLNIYAQGDVIFDNFGGGVVRNGFTGGEVSSADGIVVQLYASSSGNPGSFTPVPNSIVEIGLIAEGYFDGGVVRIPSSIIGPGAGAFLEVRAWESAFGNSYEQAVSAPPMNGRPAHTGLTCSSFMVPSTGNPTASPPGTPVPLSDLIPTFGIGFPCPEPAVMALGLIGAGVFLLRRRCQQS